MSQQQSSSSFRQLMSFWMALVLSTSAGLAQKADPETVGEDDSRPARRSTEKAGPDDGSELLKVAQDRLDSFKAAYEKDNYPSVEVIVAAADGRGKLLDENTPSMKMLANSIKYWLQKSVGGDLDLKNDFANYGNTHRQELAVAANNPEAFKTFVETKTKARLLIVCHFYPPEAPPAGQPRPQYDATISIADRRSGQDLYSQAFKVYNIGDIDMMRKYAASVARNGFPRYSEMVMSRSKAQPIEFAVFGIKNEKDFRKITDGLADVEGIRGEAEADWIDKQSPAQGQVRLRFMGGVDKLISALEKPFEKLGYETIVDEKGGNGFTLSVLPALTDQHLASLNQWYVNEGAPPVKVVVAWGGAQGDPSGTGIIDGVKTALEETLAKAIQLPVDGVDTINDTKWVKQVTDANEAGLAKAIAERYRGKIVFSVVLAPTPALADKDIFAKAKVSVVDTRNETTVLATKADDWRGPAPEQRNIEKRTRGYLVGWIDSLTKNPIVVRNENSAAGGQSGVGVPGRRQQNYEVAIVGMKDVDEDADMLIDAINGTNFTKVTDRSGVDAGPGTEPTLVLRVYTGLAKMELDRTIRRSFRDQMSLPYKLVTDNPKLTYRIGTSLQFPEWHMLTRPKEFADKNKELMDQIAAIGNPNVAVIVRKFDSVSAPPPGPAMPWQQQDWGASAIGDAIADCMRDVGFEVQDQATAAALRDRAFEDQKQFRDDNAVSESLRKSGNVTLAVVGQVRQVQPTPENAPGLQYEIRLVDVRNARLLGVTRFPDREFGKNKKVEQDATNPEDVARFISGNLLTKLQRMAGRPNRMEVVVKGATDIAEGQTLAQLLQDNIRLVSSADNFGYDYGTARFWLNYKGDGNALVKKVQDQKSKIQGLQLVIDTASPTRIDMQRLEVGEKNKLNDNRKKPDSGAAAQPSDPPAQGGVQPGSTENPQPLPPPVQGKNWALLIGVAGYTDQAVPPLNGTVNDALLMYRTLKTYCGYPEDRTILLCDGLEGKEPTKANILKAAQAIAAAAQPGDTILIHFSGHGIAIKGEGYLAPLDAKGANIAGTCVPIGALRDIFDRSQASAKVMFFDACQTGVRKGGNTEGAVTAATSQGGIIALAGCAEAESSYESPQYGHGYFTYWLTKGINRTADMEVGDRNGQVDLLELYKYVRANVSSDVLKTLNQQQNPFLKADLNNVIVLANFNPQPIGAAPAPPIATPTPPPVTTPTPEPGAAVPPPPTPEPPKPSPTTPTPTPTPPPPAPAAGVEVNDVIAERWAKIAGPTGVRGIRSLEQQPRSRALPPVKDLVVIRTGPPKPGARAIGGARGNKLAALNPRVTVVPVAGGQARAIGDGGMAQQIRQLQAEPDVLLAMPNIPMTRFEFPVTENISVQWALRNDANPAADTRWNKIADRVGGFKPVLVGVVDSGIYAEDARLKSAVWTNPKEIAGNGVDDDGNGLIDDVHGWNFFENSSRLWYPKYENMNHGAFCSSIIAARLTGGKNDIVGLAPNAQIITAVNGGQGPQISVPAAIQGIIYCATSGAKVINCSFGGPAPQSAIDEISNAPIFKALEEAGVLLVIAAGNEYNDNDTGPRFPANLKRNNVISVAASDPAGKLGRAPGGPKKWIPYSNYGAKTVHIAAPGSLVLGIHEQDRSQLSYGTSFAAPQVTGAAALVWGEHPDWDAVTVRRAILETARKTPELSNRCVTGGELDIEAALNWKP